MKKIIITGATRGIGKTLVEHLSKKGFAAFGADRAFRLESHDACFELFSKYREANVLINNAGICYPSDHHTSPRDVSKMMMVNTIAPILLSNYFISHWLSKDIEGTIINISSRVARKGCANSPVYAASKAAISTFTHSVGAQLAKTKIHIFGIAPSWVKTDMYEDNKTNSDAKEAENIPMGRILLPEELVPLVEFFLSGKANYLQGQVIDLNGASYFH